MRRMVWTAACRMGFEEIDSQHRLLFAISNELLEISNPKSQEPEIKYLLRHLRDYVEKHFSYEEKFMEDKKFPGLSDHKQKHQKIVTEINNALTGSASMSALKESLETLLDGWVQSHILVEDKKYADWAKFHKIID
ncbi:MAG: bacteriohemerythrin [Melioribacteraceae bacterium]